MKACNKVVYVAAHFKPVGKEVTVKVPTGEKKSTLFGGVKDVMEKTSKWQQTGWSKSEVDGERLSEDLAKAISGLNSDGYEVVSVAPVTSGVFDFKWQSQGITSSTRIFSETEKVSGGASYGFGYGFSYTAGLSVVARLLP